jgi:folylpolyglutamate synthase/dihydropteroate synthase
VEVGVGGEYDSTNIIPKPTCTGVTSLGIDHVTVLGNTLESIAWHKGGIYKKDVTALTVEQPAGALDVLRQRAAEKEVSSAFVGSKGRRIFVLYQFILLSRRSIWEFRDKCNRATHL